MPDLARVDARLRAILAPYGDRLAVREGDAGVILEMKGHEGETWGFVAGTRLGARYGLAGQRPMGDTRQHAAAGGPRLPAPDCPFQEVISWPR